MTYPVLMVPDGDTIPILFTTYDGGTGASITMTGLALTDIEIYKDGSITQRASDNGYALIDTDGVDIDGLTGLHGFTLDLSDDSDAGFYAVGSWFTVVVSAITVDGQTVTFIAAMFRIMAAEAAAGVVDANIASTDDIDLSATQKASVNAEADTAIADAALGTAANLATVDTVVDAIKAVTDLLPNAGALTDLAAILADTAELQTDWVNGGRLDLLLDAVALEATVTALNDISTADVNAQVVDVLKTDTVTPARPDGPAARAHLRADDLLALQADAQPHRPDLLPRAALRGRRNHRRRQGHRLRRRHHRRQAGSRDGTVAAWPSTPAKSDSPCSASGRGCPGSRCPKRTARSMPTTGCTCSSSTAASPPTPPRPPPHRPTFRVRSRPLNRPSSSIAIPSAPSSPCAPSAAWSGRIASPPAAASAWSSRWRTANRSAAATASTSNWTAAATSAASSSTAASNTAPTASPPGAWKAWTSAGGCTSA